MTKSSGHSGLDPESIKMKNNWKLPAIIFAFALIAFFVFRLIQLNNIPVFVDEAIYIRWSQIMRTEATLRFIPLSDGKQPLFMWLTIPFFKFFSDPLIAGRMVSVAAGFGSLLGIAFLSWLLFGSLLTTSVTALLYSIIPFSVFFDRMALADSLLCMFGLWSLNLSILFARSKRLDHAMILGMFLGGGLITKSPAVVFYLWIILALIFFGDIKKLSKVQIKNIILGLLAIVIISQGINSILRLGPGFSTIGARNQDYVFSWKEVLTHPLNPLIGNLKSTISWLWLLFTPSIFVITFFSFLNKKKLLPILFVLLICAAPLFAQASIAKVYTSRYILFASIPLLTLSALSINWMMKKRSLLWQIITIIVIAIPLYFSYLYTLDPQKAPMSFDMRNGYLEEWTAGWGNREISNYLKDLEDQGNNVVVFTEGYFGTMPDGLQIYTEGHKNITVVGSPPDVNHLPEGLVKSAKTNKNFLIVNQSRNHLSQADLDKLILVSEFPKPQRLDGTHETLQFYALK